MISESSPASSLDALLDDVEESLSRRIGDIAAHRLVGAAREVAALHADAGRHLVEGLIEYALEEQPLLARRAELETLAAAAASLRERLERLEQRIERLGGGS